jgi:bifunctional non-homologous end joining protein LigD
VRLRRRDPRKQEAWFLIKGHDEEVRQGLSAPVLEHESLASRRRGDSGRWGDRPPAPGAVRGTPPADQAPQLCKLVEDPPDGANWISEIKFDGYRLLAWLHKGNVRLVTRNGHDWADRLPTVARAVRQLDLQSVVLDGELVALQSDGVSSFPDLQAALAAGRDHKLNFYAFDLLELEGWDLRACQLLDRKTVLEKLTDWRGLLVSVERTYKSRLGYGI